MTSVTSNIGGCTTINTLEQDYSFVAVQLTSFYSVNSETLKRNVSNQLQHVYWTEKFD